MQQPLIEYLRQSELAQPWEAVEKAETLEAMMEAGWELARALVLWLMGQVLERRAAQPMSWPCCKACGQRLQSKGWAPRQWTGVVGTVRGKRRVGRCPRGCKIGQVAPLDRALGLEAYERTSGVLQEMACWWAVFIPFDLTARLLARLAGVEVSASGVWNWVQARGRQAMARLEEELKRLAAGEQPAAEELATEVAALPLVVGADGVSVPFRPHDGHPGGAGVWREVKVGVLARFCHRVQESGKHLFVLKHRRGVAVLGDIEALKPRLWLEALRQSIERAPRVVGLSEGGVGVWRVFRELFGTLAIGILDFYHPVQNVWKAVRVWKDGRSRRARQWWEWARRRMRYGRVDDGVVELYVERAKDHLRPPVRQALENLCTYLETHREHLATMRGFARRDCRWAVDSWRAPASGSFSSASRGWGCAGASRGSITCCTYAWRGLTSASNVYLRGAPPTSEYAL